MRYRNILKGFFLVVLISGGIINVSAQEEKYIGLFVYNFTKYFEWPENMRNGNFVIEVFGHKSVFDELTRLTAGKSVGSQSIVVKNINSIDQVGRSQIIFVGHWQSRLLGDILTKIISYNTLIISESEGMLTKGSAINFVIRDNSIKFEVNLTNAKSKGLKIDPRIRELAYNVME